jgi:hypothetical protein
MILLTRIAKQKGFHHKEPQSFSLLNQSVAKELKVYNSIATKFFSGFLALLIISLSAIAQDKEGDIANAEVVITKNRQIILPKADRNFDKVAPRQAEQTKAELTYELKILPFNSPDYNPVLRPLKLKDQEIPKIYTNYVSAGFGNYASPYLEGFINSKRDRNKLFGAHFYHHSFGSGAVDNANSSSGKTTISAYGKLLGNQANVDGKLYYGNTSGNFYGYKPQATIKKDTLEQNYSQVGFSLGLENAKKSNFNYSAKAGFSSIKDNYKASESEVSVSTALSYQLPTSNVAALGVDYFLITREDAKIASYQRNLLKIKPSYSIKSIDKLILELGVNLAYQNDQSSGSNSFNVFPNIKADYQLSDAVTAFGQLIGDVDKVSLHTIYQENFWVNSNQSLINSNRMYDFTGGLKGKVGKRVAFSLGVSSANLKSYYFYKSDLVNRAKFDLDYESGNTKRTNLFAQLSFNQADVVKLSLRSDYFTYSRDSGLDAYHRPAYRLGFNSMFNVYNKLVFNADFIALGGMKAFDNEKKTSVELNPALDLGFKADYILSKNASVFLKFNNLLSNNYQLYLNYPVRGFQAMAGISCTF